MESICFNFYDVLSLFGSFLSILLGCILIFNEKFSTKSNIALAIGLFSTALLIARNILLNLDFVTYESFIAYTPLFYGLLIPLGFYFNINYLLNPNYQLKRRDYWLIAPIFLIIITDLLFLSAYIFYPAFVETNPNVIIRYGDIFFNLITIGRNWDLSPKNKLAKESENA